MSQKKKKRSTGPKSRPSRAGSPARHDSRERRSTAESRLLVQFAAWYTLHLAEVDPDDVHGELADVQETLAMLMDMTRTLGPGHTLATPVARTLEELLDLTVLLGEEAASDGVDGLDLSSGEQLAALVDVLAHYLDFLSETNSWRASDAEFEASYAALDTMSLADLTAGLLGDLFAALDHLPAVPAAEQLHALQQLPVVAGVDRVLAWVGQGKPVTGTGGLRLADIEPVAALIGLHVVGQKGAVAARTGDADVEFALDTVLGRPHSPDAPSVVGSMWDDAPLSTWWIALSLTGLLDVGAASARPGATAASWHRADAAEQLASRTGFVDQYVQEWFENEAALDLESTPHILIRVLTMLSAAISPEVLPELGTAAITDLVDEELGFETSFASAMRSSMVLAHLRAAGLVVPEPAPDGTERFVVPAALRPAVRRGLRPSIDALTRH